MTSVIATRIRRYAALCRQIAPAIPNTEALERQAAQAIADGRDMPLADLVGLILHLVRVGPPDIGLRFGRAERLSDLGIIGHAIAASDTLKQALAIWLGRADDHEPLLRFQSTVRGADWSITVHPVASLPPPVRRFLVDEWMASLFAFLAETTGITDPNAQIELRHAPPPGVDHALWLPACPRFRASSNRLILPATLLQTELRARNTELLDLILSHFRDPVPGKAGLGDRVRHLLIADRLERQTIEGAAAALGLSHRTLVRHLTREGTSFWQILDDHRRAHALILAREGRLGAKDIARVLGFANHQSLRRAFLRWTGHPLGRWRADQQAIAQLR